MEQNGEARTRLPQILSTDLWQKGQYNEEKRVSSKNVAGTTGHLHAKKNKTLDTDLYTLHKN